MAPVANVRIEVTAELAIDLLDHVPLVERQRSPRSGRWDADGLLGNVSPRALLDIFVTDLAHAVKPVSSFFSAKKRDVCGYRHKEASHRQSYSIVTPAGRVAEVVVDSSVVGPGHNVVISAEHGDYAQNIGTSTLSLGVSQIDTDPRRDELEPDLMSSKFGILVKLCSLDEAAVMPSIDSPCPETCNVSVDCDMYGGDVNLSRVPVNSIDCMAKCSSSGRVSSSAMSTCSPSDNSSKKEARSDPRMDELEPNLMSSKFGILVKVCPLDEAAVMSSIDSPCPETCNVSVDCDMNGGDVNVSRVPVNSIDCMTKCPCSGRASSSDMSACSPSDNSSKKEANKFSGNSLETAHKADTRYMQVLNSVLPSFAKRVKVEPMAENVPNGTQEIGPKHASTVSLDHLNAPDKENVTTVASVLPDLRDDLGSMSPNDIIPPQNPESICTTNDRMVSDVKPSLGGHKALLHDADNCICGQLLSTIHTKITSEPMEECYNDPQVDSMRSMATSTSGFQEKMLENHAVSSASLDFINSVKYDGSEVPTLPEYRDNIRCSPLSHHSEVELPILEKRQPNSDDSDCNPGIFMKVEASEVDIGGAISGHTDKHLVALESSSFPAEVKAEPLAMVFASPENCEEVLPCHDSTRTCVKMESINEPLEDALDHISLKKRRKMLVSSNNSSFGCTSSLKHSKHSRRHSSSVCPATSENTLEKYSGRPRKRKRTSTDSVETALEEDAPELLQVLVAQGINLDEIKLYGSMEDYDMVDIISSEDSFEDHENVASKLFLEPSNSLLNLTSLRDRRGSKATYCLSCLFSLIEQMRYLQLRNCPVQWGWCRDLQSFIFVFEKHNRIVLERPEYGYATYFFELVDSLPIDWQIMRLVTAMKATHCCRTTIVENKSLLVGQDLTEGEARVLKEYGWKPNSGLGSLLNFCDRVVHDRKNEMNNSEWKAKIGKLLMNGYEGGRLVVDNLPKKVVEYMGDRCPTLKLEIDYMYITE